MPYLPVGSDGTQYPVRRPSPDDDTVDSILFSRRARLLYRDRAAGGEERREPRGPSLPDAERAADRHELPDVIGIVIRGEQDPAQHCLVRLAGRDPR